MSLEKKYSDLAKEALSSGDKTSSENYFQHADHFMRIIEDKKRNQNIAKTQTAEEKKDIIPNPSQNQTVEEEKK